MCCYVGGGNGRTVIQKGRPSCVLHVVYLEWSTRSTCSRLRLWRILPHMYGELVGYRRTEVDAVLLV